MTHTILPHVSDRPLCCRPRLPAARCTVGRPRPGRFSRPGSAVCAGRAGGDDAPALTEGGRDRPGGGANKEQPSSTSTAEPPPPQFAIIAGLAAAGALETGYLLATELMGSSVACPTSGCDTVLSSSYGFIFGAPLPLWGMLTYTATTAAAARGATSSDTASAEPCRVAVTAAGAALAACSAYLVATLVTKLGGDCTYCLASAGISATICAVALSMPPPAGAGTVAAGVPLGAAAAAALALAVGFGDLAPTAPPPASQSQSESEVEFLPYEQHVVTTPSSREAIAAAQALRAAGAKMYGAFWCTHCNEQKEILGAEAFAMIDYVECYPSGWRPGGVGMDASCAAAGLKGYPTWDIAGKKVEGDKTVAQLAALAGVDATRLTAAASALPQ